MSLYELIDILKQISLKVPNINNVYTGDIYDLNESPDITYPCIVLSQGSHSTDTTNETATYEFNIFAVDRLLEDESNRLDVQSWADGVLKSIFNEIENEGLTVINNFNTQVFTERFTSYCGGAYSNMQISYDINYCGSKLDVSSCTKWGNLFGNLSDQTDLKQKLDTIPTKTSQITNDSGFITSDDIPTIPTKTSQLTNDSNFITSDYHDNTKQDTLTAGTGIKIENNTISATETGGASLKSNVTIAGGYLANNIEEAVDPQWPTEWTDELGNKFLPSGLTFEQFVQRMFLLEKYGKLSGPVYSWTPSQNKPTVTISKTGSHPVGTEVTLTVTQNTTVSNKAASASITGATYGYSLDGTTKTSSNTSYSKSSADGAVSGTNTITSNWNGETKTVEGVIKYYVKDGTNTLSATQTGLSISAGSFTEQNVYAMTNVKTVKTSEVKTINQSGFEASSAYSSSKSLGSSNSTTVTGFYPVFYGGTSDTNLAADGSTITSTMITSLASGYSKSTVPSTISITSGTGSLFLAVKGSTKTKMNTVTSGNYSFGESHYVDINIPMLNDVETVSYRVYFISNADKTGNPDTIKITLS